MLFNCQKYRFLNSYTFASGDAATPQRPPHLLHAPPVPQPSNAEPYSVQSLTFSPAIDISVLRQVSLLHVRFDYNSDVSTFKICHMITLRNREF